MKRRICVDFDGTIFDGVGIFPGCVARLTELQLTHVVAIHSARATDAERQQMIEILAQHNVPHDEVLPPKPDADIYIDDKGHRFDGWDKIKI